MYGLWLNNIPGITYARRRMIYEACGSAKELYGMDEKRLYDIPGLETADVLSIMRSRDRWNPEAEWMKLAERGISFVSIEDSNYPKRLRNISSPPHALYYVGKLPDENRRSIAVVGARMRSAYGSQIARALARKAAEAGAQVISGMAAGIDADGHMGALDAGAETFAVLGCGVDVCYPKRNRFLYENIVKKGGILSEYPAGAEPRREYFPGRNRIISGLSDCVAVIEAREKSGSLITADYAMEQGREVYALPGRITDPLSQGTNRLIRQGAGVITGVSDFLEELALFGAGAGGQIDFRKNLLEKDEAMVYSLFDFAPLGIGSIVQKSALGLTGALDILQRLEQKGYVKETVPNYFVKII